MCTDKIQLWREPALRSTAQKGEVSHSDVTKPKRPALYTPKFPKFKHFTCQNAENSCILHVKMLNNCAFRKVLHSPCQNTEKLRTLRAKMPKRPALYMPKIPKFKHFTCKNAENSCIPHVKMPNNYAFRNVLHSPCQNTEKLRTLRVKTPKRPTLHATTSKHTYLRIVNFIYHIFTIIIPPQQKTLSSHNKEHSVNFAWSNILCLLEET